ncbi:MAG: putative sporulation protein YtxC [Clostridia bacterium]|nr:putative sporulation protein YtxC [Clostridia bacterium]
MKSFCIKNNNKQILDYLLAEFQNMNIENTYISQNSFKYYQNIIVHYTGKNENVFIYKLSEIITNCIMKFYEKNIVKRVINSDYFYFDVREKKVINNNCYELLNDEQSNDFLKRKEKILSCLIEYISEHKFFILDGFVNFRLFEYNSLIEECVDCAVNKFIIDKEYKEFIELLRGYINSQKTRSETIHVIYSNSEPILMDEKQNILVYENQFEHPKYLSDITFSSKDYCLNALLNLLPKKIIVHLLVDEDEFIETLRLIFQNRLMICKECNICKTFTLLNVH